jgi:hypothetical protein
VQIARGPGSQRSTDDYGAHFGQLPILHAFDFEHHACMKCMHLLHGIVNACMLDDDDDDVEKLSTVTWKQNFAMCESMCADSNLRPLGLRQIDCSGRRCERLFSNMAGIGCVLVGS